MDRPLDGDQIAGSIDPDLDFRLPPGWRPGPALDRSLLAATMGVRRRRSSQRAA